MARTRNEILEAVKNTVTVDREKSYGTPENNFALIARFWKNYLGNRIAGNLDSSDVAAMMALLKIARISTGRYKEDNWIDLAGYAICGGSVASYNEDANEENIN